MPNALIFDIEATDKDNLVLIEAIWIEMKYAQSVLQMKLSST
jgi:hypothetical protein